MPSALSPLQHYDLFILEGLHFDSMRAGRWLCDAIAESGTAGASEASPPACSIIIYYYVQTIPLIRIHIGLHRNANTKNLKDCK